MIPSGLGYSIRHQKESADPTWRKRVLETLPTAWYHNWTHADALPWVYQVPVCWHTKPGAYFDRAITTANEDPTRFWIVDNEPEHEGQSNTSPVLAARQAQRWTMETRNPWAGGSNIWMTPWPSADYTFETAIAWLNAYLQAGGPLPDYWNMHMFLWDKSPEEDFDAIIKVHDSWMKDRNAVRPRIVSEVCWLYNSAMQQKRLMLHLLKRIADGTIQAAAWFCSWAPELPMSNLLTENGKITDAGIAWQDVWQVTGQSDDKIVYLPGVMA